MRVTIEDLGVREFDANRVDVTDDGFVNLSKGSNFVAAIPCVRVVLIEMADEFCGCDGVQCCQKCRLRSPR